ncbi:MAG TPA: R3H domain-containing nucleic acid-binding protein [Candidatus Saccharimonadales bacterium]|jgi:spoIIIJ-associated protein
MTADDSVQTDEDGTAGAPAASYKHDSIDEAILFARKYLEDILSFFGINTDVHATTEDDEVIELDIPSTHLNGFLIGQHGDTMRALQFVVSSALKNNNYRYTRVNVDVAAYKKQRADRLAETAQDWIKIVQDSGEPYALRPMNAADRRIVHKVAGEAGLTTESVGEGRERHIILKPAAIDDDKTSAATEEE